MLFLALVVFPYLDAVRTLATNAAVTLHAPPLSRLSSRRPRSPAP